MTGMRPVVHKKTTGPQGPVAGYGCSGYSISTGTPSVGTI